LNINVTPTFDCAGVEYCPRNSLSRTNKRLSID
jgi:hypothetical protein